MGDVDAQLGQQQRRAAQAQALGIERHTEGGGPAGYPLSLKKRLALEDLAGLLYLDEHGNHRIHSSKLLILTVPSTSHSTLRICNECIVITTVI